MSAIQFTDRGGAVRVSGESGVLARAALAAARTAPAILSRRPWRWRVDGRTLELRPDRARHLPNLDPDDRLLTVSCGAALHHARTALAADGARTRIRYLPEPAEPDVLATLTHLDAGPPDPAALRTYRAMAARHSDRRAFANRADQPVPDAAWALLGAAAEREGAHLHVMTGEQLAWLTPTTADADGGGATYVTIVTDADTRRDWLAAGEALSATLLAATAEGLSTSVISHAAATAQARARLRRALPGPGHPAMVVRVGSPAAGPDRTGGADAGRNDGPDARPDRDLRP